MPIEVFNRHEKKYRMGEHKLNILQRHLSDYMELDKYNSAGEPYTITNIYYDTADSFLIRTSLQKPKYKEKLRLRAYGIPANDTTVYIEIKKKVDGVVNKRRSGMKLDEAYKFLKTGELPGILPHMNQQVLHEVEYILEQHALEPRVYLAYDRMAYFNLGSGDLRISFDTNIRFRTDNLRLEAGDFGNTILPKNQWLMEIKTDKAMPIWLTKLLSAEQLYPTSFSKYGYIYQELQKPQELKQTVFTFPTPLEKRERIPAITT